MKDGQGYDVQGRRQGEPVVPADPRPDIEGLLATADKSIGLPMSHVIVEREWLERFAAALRKVAAVLVPMDEHEKRRWSRVGFEVAALRTEVQSWQDTFGTLTAEEAAADAEEARNNGSHMESDRCSNCGGPGEVRTRSSVQPKVEGLVDAVEGLRSHMNDARMRVHPDTDTVKWLRLHDALEALLDAQRTKS